MDLVSDIKDLTYTKRGKFKSVLDKISDEYRPVLNEIRYGIFDYWDDVRKLYAF